MAETKIAALRVSAEMDAKGFTAGANEIDAAAKKAGAATKNLGDSLNSAGAAAEQFDVKLRPASDGLNKLMRTVVDGYAASQNLERALNTISRAMDKGKISADMAARAVEGAVRKYGVMGDAAIFASRNQLELAAATDRANASLTRQAGIRPANQNMQNGGQSFAAQNLMYQFQDIGVTAAMGMNPLMIALQQGTQISAALGPMGAAGAVGALRAAFVGLINPVSLVTVGLVAAGAAAIQYLMPLLSQGEEANKKLEEHRRAIDEIAKRWGDVAPAFKAYADERERLANIEKIAGATETAKSDQWTKLKEQIVDVNLVMADYFQQAATANSESIELREAQSAWNKLHGEVEGGKASAETARAAQKELLDLFRESGIPGIKEFADSFGKLADEIERAAVASAKLDAEGARMDEFLRLSVIPGVNQRGFLITDPDRPGELEDELSRRAAEEQAVERRRIEEANRAAGIGIPIPQERPKSQYPAIDSEPEKSATAYENLTRAADQRIEQLRHEISIVGEATAVQAQLRAEFEAEQQYREQMARNNLVVDERELAALREKARLQAQLTQQLAGVNFDKSQQQEIAALQQRASVIGLSAEAAARSNAIFQAEQQMRQQGISLLGEEADRRRAVAAATADYASAIQRSEQAYASLQTAGSSAIDALFAQTGSLEDRLKNAASAMLSWITQLALANPLKNALFGTNLPTLADLGKPAVPGLSATSTGTMTVTAGVVNVAGGSFPSIPGASLPGTTTNGGLLSVLGATNGVRPTLTPGGIVNSPVPSNALANPALAGLINDPSLAARVNPVTTTGSIEDYIRNAAIQRGIDPNIAVRVAQSEGGLQSWNLQSQYFKNGIQEPSFGPFQLLKGGPGTGYPTGLGNDFMNQTGLDPALAANGPQGVDFALDHASRNGWSAWYGARNAGISRWEGIGTNPGIDNTTTNSISSSMQKLTQSTTSAVKGIDTLGDSSTQVGSTLADSLGKLAAPAAVPPVPAPTAAAPATGGGIFSSLFGSIFKLFGFADGTDFAPGGMAIVGERGPELVSLPRGSQVTPNHKLQGPNSEERMRGRMVRQEFSIQISGLGDKDLLEKMNAAAREAVKRGIVEYDSQVLSGRVQEIAENPEFVG